MIRSPRFVRPRNIIVQNYKGEIDHKATYEDCNIDYVKFDGTYGIRQSNKGIKTDDKAIITIDCNDLVAYLGDVRKKYLDPIEYKQLEDTISFFTLRPDIDIVVYKGKEYVITSVNPICPFKDTPEYIEVTVK